MFSRRIGLAVLAAVRSSPPLTAAPGRETDAPATAAGARTRRRSLRSPPSSTPPPTARSRRPGVPRVAEPRHGRGRRVRHSRGTPTRGARHRRQSPRPTHPRTGAAARRPSSCPSRRATRSSGHYCGPAVGQVIANYTWAVPLQANKYTQSQIAVWMATDANGGTSAFTMEDGLERATAGAPRRPATWDWVVTRLEDTDLDGTFGDQLHDYVRANMTGSGMALAISVKPHDPNGRFHLEQLAAAGRLRWPLDRCLWLVGDLRRDGQRAPVLHRLIRGRGRGHRPLLGSGAPHRRHDPRPPQRFVW